MVKNVDKHDHYVDNNDELGVVYDILFERCGDHFAGSASCQQYGRLICSVILVSISLLAEPEFS